MRFFRRKNIPKPSKHLQRVVVGFVIGAAISSIVGKKITDRSHDDASDDLQDGDDRGR